MNDSPATLAKVVFIFAILFSSCQQALETNSQPTLTLPTRYEGLVGLVKVDPASDAWPPLASGGWTQPEPLAGPVNTAGVEDSPFLSVDGEWFVFVFIPDPKSTPQEQLLDGVSGIWATQRAGDSWAEPKRVRLTQAGEVSLDGCPTLYGNILYFCSVRQANQRQLEIYTAVWANGAAANWQNAGEQFNSSFEMGEMHISSDGQTLVFASQRTGGLGGYDLWISILQNGNWSKPTNLGAPVNTPGDENRPYLAPDGSLWFDAPSRKGLPGPAIFRSQRQVEGSWSDPEEIISQFAGEPHLSADGQTLYFVHHYFSEDLSTMLEADIFTSQLNNTP